MTDATSPPGLLVVAGATGTGKSDFAISVAERLAEGGTAAEIINADAMQLYRGMDIGTAKLTVQEQRQIPHHLFDVLEVTEESTVAAYQQRARSTIEAVQSRGAVPILVGGSGLYISSTIFDFQFPARDAAVRQRLEHELDELGPGALHARLRAVDEDAARAIGASNGRRLVRALEVVTITGKPLSGELPDVPVPWQPHRIIALGVERATLVARLDQRVHGMWQSGLLREVEQLLEQGLEQGVTASRAIGYAQAIAQLRGEYSESEAIDSTQALTRRYARRQVSWFRRYESARWVDSLDEDARTAALIDTVRLSHGSAD